MFWTGFVVHHQESSTVYTAIGICHTEILKMGNITSVYTCTSYLKCKTCFSNFSMTNTYCFVYNTRLLMMDSKPVRNIQHFNYQLMHTTLKNVELLKHFKISKTAPTCFGLQGNHHQGATIST